MKRILMLSAVTRVERHHATSLVLDNVNALGGWIEDVRLYSNIMTNIRLVLKGDAIAALVDRLEAEGLAIDRTEMLTALGNGPGEAEQTLSLQLNFIHNEPDLKREIPAVPG